MPAATPLPRGPSVLTLYSAEDLLTAPGCPVCRYADEASDRYLAWFALEGHADPGAITRLCASLGMCPGHTRALIRQPGAGTRLAALYRYLIAAARERLAGPGGQLAPCPACQHQDGVTGRALETLLDGLADGAVRDRYRDLGGLCLPHLRAGAARGRRRASAWLADTMLATLRARPGQGTGRRGSAPLEPAAWLAGLDRDAGARAALRQAIPARLAAGRTCEACAAAARAERERLAGVAGADRLPAQRPGLPLCPAHLADLLHAAGPGRAVPLLDWQADCYVASLPHAAGRLPRGWAVSRHGWPRAARAAAPCPVCRGAADAVQRVLGDLAGRLQGDRAGRHARSPQRAELASPQLTLCVRHVLALAAVDQRAARPVAQAAAEHARRLAGELDEAFRKNTWAYRQTERGAEMTAWRRAAAFLDGGIFGGQPPRE
jgi:hypothetical protein